MTNTIAKPPKLEVLPISKMWWNLQKFQSAITRWKHYLEYNPNLPRQTNTEHVAGFKRMAEILMLRMAAHLGPQNTRFDHEFIMRAIDVHDDGEGILKRDVSYYKKSAKDDLNELNALKLSLDDGTERRALERAFLLQFVAKGDFEVFEGDQSAMKILRELYEFHMLDARMFNAFERLDYVQFAQICYEQYGDCVILTQVLRSQAKALRGYQDTIPGFREVVWTDAHVESTAAFMDHFKEMPGSGEIPVAYGWAIENNCIELPPPARGKIIRYLHQ